MTIRDVTKEQDITAVETLADAIWREHYTSIIGKAQVDYMLHTFQSKRAIKKQLEDGASYYMMMDAEIPIGYMSVYLQKELLFLSKIYVDTSKRGQGHASHALSFLEELAVDNGIYTVELTVNKHNTLAVTAYERMGFKNSGSIVQDIGHGFVMDDFVMRKSIKEES